MKFHPEIVAQFRNIMSTCVVDEVDLRKKDMEEEWENVDY